MVKQIHVTNLQQRDTQYKKEKKQKSCYLLFLYISNFVLCELQKNRDSEMYMNAYKILLV